MRADRIATGDVIKARVKGRTLWGEVTEVKDGVVCFTPISPAAGWRHASAREIIGLWRKNGRHRHDEPEPVPTGELALKVWT